MSKEQTLARGKHVRMMVFGDPGIGKTRLAGTSPGKVLILRPPVDHTDSILPADRERVKERVVPDWDEMHEVLDELRQEGGKWDWVWFDSISLWQDVGLDDIWETVIAEKPHRARFGLDKQEYNINMTRLSRWVRHMVGPDLFNFGITAHPAELKPSEDPDAEEILMPWVQGKNMSPKICGYMNVVAFYEMRNGKRWLRFNKTDRYYGKDQYDAFPKGRLQDPTMPKVMDAIDKARGTTAGKRPKGRRRNG